jgi:hypothetical protein
MWLIFQVFITCLLEEAIIRQYFCYWGDHCTVHFVFCALRHMVVFVVSFFRRILPLYLFWWIFQSFVSFTLLWMFLVLPSLVRDPLSQIFRDSLYIS